MISSNVMKFIAPLFAVLVTLCAGPLTQAQLTVDGYTAPVNDRFTNDPSFILNGFDISAVGQTSSTVPGPNSAATVTVGGSRFVTAISSNVVVGAYHNRAAIGQEVSFFPGNDPNGVRVTRNVVSEIRVPNNTGGLSDLWLGVLDSNLPSSISPVAFTNQALSGTPPSGSSASGPLNTDSSQIPFIGENAFIFGRSPDGSSLFTTQAVGRNRITGYFEDVSANGGVSDALYASYDSEPFAAFFPTGNNIVANLVANEALTIIGDSGGPLFIEDNGQLVLLGTNAFTVPVEIAGVTETVGSAFNYVGNNAEFIENFITVNSVPEPSAGLVLSTLLAGFLIRRRRP